MNSRSALATLRANGFDSSARIGRGRVVVACSSCEALVINGHPCHETGCPNARRECLGCNEMIPIYTYARYCTSCAS